ncbi:MAG: molecular chaperone SurA, partial [Methylophilaceae bacterium]
MKLFNATPSLAKLIIGTGLTMASSLLSLNAYALNDILKLDRIVAIVDNHAITEQELDNKVLTVSNRLEKKGTELPPELVLRKQVLERLIIDSIQLQLAEK